MPTLILYTNNNSARLQYVARFVFEYVLGVSYEITEDEIYFNTMNCFKINYSLKQEIPSDLKMNPYGLLDEANVQDQKIEMFIWNDLPCFFKTGNDEISFDLFSATFYLVSRYEEYLPYEQDVYKRFPVEKSLAYQKDFLGMPLVDYWILELKKIISNKSASIFFPEKKMRFIPTYDIDIAYSYIGKGMIRNLGGAMKDLFSLKFSSIKNRLSVLLGKEKDPYDSFHYLNKLHEKYSLSPIYFFLLSKGGSLDKNISPSHPLMQNLITKIKSSYQIGIHPSYQSNDNKKILQAEIELLQSDKSRQHFIRFELPFTFRNLIEYGIREDYSMGYGSINGFRASTSHPHLWFDVLKNEASFLMLYPFCYMECNSFFEQKNSAEEALKEMIDLYKHVEKVDGTFICIWHNFSLGTDNQWSGWKEVYEKFVQKMPISYEHKANKRLALAWHVS